MGAQINIAQMSVMNNMILFSTQYLIRLYYNFETENNIPNEALLFGYDIFARLSNDTLPGGYINSSWLSQIVFIVQHNIIGFLPKLNF